MSPKSNEVIGFFNRDSVCFLYDGKYYLDELQTLKFNTKIILSRVCH
jgi:hypothetical protein